MDLNVTVKLTCDEYMTKLITAVLDSLDAIDGARKQEATPEPAAAAPVPTPTPAPAPVAPVPAPAPAVPVAPARTYTIDELMAAAAQLMDAGKIAQLQALLPKYNIPSFSALKPEQYGAFATDLRSMGARL